MTIVKIEQKHKKAIVELLKRSIEIYEENLTPQQLVEASLPVYTKEDLTDDYTLIADNKPVGFLSFKEKPTCMWINSIHVDPEYRNTGIASQLLKFVESFGKPVAWETVLQAYWMINFSFRNGYKIYSDEMLDGMGVVKLPQSKYRHIFYKE